MPGQAVAPQPATADALIWREIVRRAAAGEVAPEQLAPLVAWHLQGRPAAEVCRSFSIAGRKDLELRLRGLLTG